MHTWVCRNCRRMGITGCTSLAGNEIGAQGTVFAMRLTLEEEIEYAIWKITGVPYHYRKDLVSHISRVMAEKTGEDAGEVSLALISQIKEIIREDVSLHFRRIHPGCAASDSCQPAEGTCHE